MDPEQERARVREIMKVARAIELRIEKELRKMDISGLLTLEVLLQQWARRILRHEGPPEGAQEGTKEGALEGPPSGTEGAPNKSKEPFKFPFYSPFQLIRLAHSHPLCAKILSELVRRDRLAPQLSVEEETTRILALRDNNKKGWTAD